MIGDVMFSVKKLDPFGILITPISSDDLLSIDLIHLIEIINEHKLIIIRDFQSLPEPLLLDYCQRDYELLQWSFGPVMNMKVSPNATNYLFTHGDVPLHWDGAFHRVPDYLFFQALEVPDNHAGGETVFCHSEKVWQSLTVEEQEQWAQLRLHYQTEKVSHYGGEFEQSLVNVHPLSKRIILRYAEIVDDSYLNPVMVKVDGIDNASSLDLIKMLSDKFNSPEFIYQHSWQQGDYLIADNYSLLHGRNAFAKTTKRHLKRIQLINLTQSDHQISR